MGVHAQHRGLVRVLAAASISLRPGDLARIAPLCSCAYFLDADGTLLDIMPRPEDVVAYEGLRTLLAGLVGAARDVLALVSGRAIKDIDRIFAPLIFPAAVAELKQAHHDKGRGIATLLATPPFSGRKPVFIGDDLTDESGFSFVNAQGGVSVRVGPAEAATEARYNLRDPGDVRAELLRLLASPGARTLL